MYEQLQIPVVPFVIFGAYDLYPVGTVLYDHCVTISYASLIFCPFIYIYVHLFVRMYVGTWVNNTGRVLVRYLRPIMPVEARDRESMCRLVSHGWNLEAGVDYKCIQYYY